MNEKVLKILEFDKIISFLSEHATCKGGKKLCKELVPYSSINKVSRALSETDAAVLRIHSYGDLSFRGVADITDYRKRLELGLPLSAGELLNVAAVLSAAETAVTYDKKDDLSKERDCLSGIFSSLFCIPDLRKEITRCILSEDEIADDASPKLRSIRKELSQIGGKIHTELAKILNGSERSYLQEAIITQRDGRYCVPVKSEYKSQIPGMVHDHSKGGSTLFIEPMSVVKLNNDIRELSLSETEEINAILAALSIRTANYCEAIFTDYERLVSLDFIFSRARYAISGRMHKPVIEENSAIDLKKARHPLIDKDKVVPIDINLGKDFSQLIITGPNTGGKTVTLKTVGLLSLMGLSGLFIPALENSTLTFFDEIFADIGDKQSIEMSLSTFSSHMTDIVDILENTTQRSLVLFDELCAGTDPSEGAALAMAILAKLLSAKVYSIATTHYSELKIYALSTPGVQNACCEFSVETLSPTYKLLIGIPGKSNAFAISEKLGLPNDIIQEAKRNLGANDKAFEDVIADLEHKRITLEKEQAEASALREEALSLKEKLSVKEASMNEKKDSILEKAREEAADILREAKETADDVIRQINKGNNGSGSIREMEAGRRKLREEINKHAKTVNTEKTLPNNSNKPSDFHIGDIVFVRSMGLNGTVHSLPDNKGMLTVTMGILNSSVNINDLDILPEETAASRIKDKSSSIGKIRMNKAQNISTEINLIGLNKDEALTELDKYLDDAYLSHLTSVRIVHGKGSGILREAVHGYLRKHKKIKSFRLGEFGEGDFGVTIAEFKD